jgi:hypothetical protein
MARGIYEFLFQVVVYTRICGRNTHSAMNPHSRNITENHLGRSYSDDKTVNLEEFLDYRDVGREALKCEPEVGNSIIQGSQGPGIALSGDKKRL